MIILYIINLEIARDQKIERERVEEIDRRRKRQKKRYIHYTECTKKRPLRIFRIYWMIISKLFLNSTFQFVAFSLKYVESMYKIVNKFLLKLAKNHVILHILASLSRLSNIYRHVTFLLCDI